MSKYNFVDELSDLNKSVLNTNKFKDDEFVNIDIINEHEVSESNIDNRLILFDINQYLEKIMQSYDMNLNNIIQQYKLDFCRSVVYFNDNIITDHSYLMSQLLKYAPYRIELGGKQYSLDITILMICTQASFVFSFILMNKLYSNYYLGKQVTSDKARYKINIQTNGTIEINLDAIYNIKNISNNTIIGNVNVITNINIVCKHKKYEFSKLGIMTWNTNKK